MSGRREFRFKLGDVVVLRSGGPNMAVDRIEIRLDSSKIPTFALRKAIEDAPISVHCKWFDGEKLMWAEIVEDALVIRPAREAARIN